MKNTQDEIPSTNDMITYGNSKEPNKYSYTKITTTESGDKKVKNLDMITTTTTIIKKEETQPIKKTTGGSTSQTIKESTYYEKRGSTTARSNNTLLPTKAIARYSYSGPKLPDSFIRSGVQTTKITTTTTTSTVQRGKYGKNNKDENIPSQSYRGQKKGQSPENTQSSKYQLKKPDTEYRKKALSPDPGSIQKKTINRGKPVENIQITHIIVSSKPAEFHITERLNVDNLNSPPIEIPVTERKRLRRTGKVTHSSSCDKIDIKSPKYNLKGSTIIYQHARGIGMTNDKKDNINSKYYPSDIKKFKPIKKEKGEEKIEHIETFRSTGRNLLSPNPTTKTTTTKTTNYTVRPNYKQNKYRTGLSNPAYNKEGGKVNNKVTTTTSTIRSINYKRGNNNAENEDGEIIKETNIKVQMGSRSFKNQSQPKTYVTQEKKVYERRKFFNNK